MNPFRYFRTSFPVAFRGSVVSAVVLTLLLIAWGSMAAGEHRRAVPASRQKTQAAHGYELIRHKAYLPPDFDQDVFDSLWTVWPEPLRSRARKASAADRRKMAFSRYGLVEPPGTAGKGPALGYTSDGKGGWVMNCLACHGGKVAGRVIPGVPNSLYALQTLTEDVRAVKVRLKKPWSHMDYGSLKIPLGNSNGTTNAVVFGVALGALRDADMNVRRPNHIPKLLHHDLDPPPFWNVRKKTRLYADGFIVKTHRPLLQFILLPSISGKTVRSWDGDFQDILAWIESLTPPKYPWPIDNRLAARGRTLFNRRCSRCHGTYGPGGQYAEKIIPLKVAGTDPLRLRALSVDARRQMRISWMSHYGKDDVIVDPGGYVAPPLDGIWASAPYFHNGSVPTLWHVLHPDKRPTVWKRSEDGYDRTRTGLEITTFAKMPASVRTAAERRRYFDTTRPGKSAAGHRFPDRLSEQEKQAVLEYLKTL